MKNLFDKKSQPLFNINNIYYYYNYYLLCYYMKLDSNREADESVSHSFNSPCSQILLNPK